MFVAGPFLKSVIRDMKRKITDEKYEEKLHVYSAHDSTLWTIMTGLKVYDNIIPAYGSSLIFELREKNSTNYVTVSSSSRKQHKVHARIFEQCQCQCPSLVAGVTDPAVLLYLNNDDKLFTDFVQK